MRIARLATAVVALGVLLPASALAADRLPFPDGRYVTDPAICELDDAQIVDRYTDATGKYVRNIKGRQITDGYELSCEIKRVQKRGSDVIFQAICDSEGGSEEVTGRYIAIAEDAFALRGSVFRRCTTAPPQEAEEPSEEPSEEAGSEYEPGSFPLASCSGWSGTIVSISNVDTKNAMMTGIITKYDLREYCDRDPGGETTQFGGKMTRDECVSKYMAEQKNRKLKAVANCGTGKLSLTGTYNPMTAKFPLDSDADTSCASGMPPLMAQFKALCPTAAKRINLQ